MCSGRSIGPKRSGAKPFDFFKEDLHHLVRYRRCQFNVVIRKDLANRAAGSVVFVLGVVERSGKLCLDEVPTAVFLQDLTDRKNVAGYFWGWKVGSNLISKLFRPCRATFAASRECKCQNRTRKQPSHCDDNRPQPPAHPLMGSKQPASGCRRCWFGGSPTQLALRI